MKRTRLLGSLLAASILLVTGCGGSQEAAKVTASTPASQAQAAVQTIKFYFPVQVAGPLSQKMEALIADFEQLHPDVDVEMVFAGNYTESFQKIMTAHIGGNPPEVAIMNGSSTWALKEAGAVEPLDGYVAEAGGEQFLADFQEGFLSDARIGGQLYGLPFQKSTPILYWNKDAFREAGLDPEKPPQTWQELQDYAIKLTAREGNTVKRWGIEIPGDTWNMQSLIMQNDGQVSNEQGTKTFLDQKPAVEALQFLTDLVNHHKVMPAKRTYPDSSQDFVAGQAAMIYNTPGGLAFVRDSAKFAFGVAPLPAGKVQIAPTGGAQLVIFSKAPAEKKEAAWKFVSWLTEKEQTARWMMDSGYIAVRKSAVEVPELKAYLDQYPQARSTIEAATLARRDQSIMHEGPKVAELINLAVQQALAGQKSPQEALTEAQQKADALLRKFQ